ncbi:MAG: RNA polymerase sigma factor [Phycisphaerales bacterium]
MRALAGSCAAGDRAAFDLLHSRFSGGVRAFFSKRGVASAADVADLSQRVWFGVWTACESGRFDPARASISTFIYAVAHKTWLQFLRVRSGGWSENATEDALFEVSDLSADDPAMTAAAAERLEALRSFLQQRSGEGALTDLEHRVLIASSSGATDRELAESLSLAPSTINARKHAGLGKVRRFLARLGFAPESAERGSPSRE